MAAIDPDHPRDMRRQRDLLLAEGVAVSPTGRIDLTRYAWKPRNRRPR